MTTGLRCRGRKKAALTYVITYCIGCATKHWNMFIVLLVGRLFCGVATSLLYSAFESWLVAEHFKVCPARPSSLTLIRSLASLCMTAPGRPKEGPSSYHILGCRYGCRRKQSPVR